MNHQGQQLQSSSMNRWCIVVLGGGNSPEANISKISAETLAQDLKEVGLPKVELLLLEKDEIPEQLNPKTDIIFPALHGSFGEDGGIQQIFEAQGFFYAGSPPEGCQVCMHKTLAKKAAQGSGFAQAKHLSFSAHQPPHLDAIIAELGHSLILKPENQGSSIGVQGITGPQELKKSLQNLHHTAAAKEPWMLEQRLRGLEMSIGILQGRALEPICIEHDTLFSYTLKYESPNAYKTEVPIQAELRANIQNYAQKAFLQCKCRDFARIDLIVVENTPYFLEINAIPGLSEKSLIRASAKSAGIDGIGLARALITPALRRARKS